MAGVARDDSPEAKVFRRHYALLVSAIQEPESLADGLFSRNVIGMGLLQELQLDSLTKAKKNRKLLLAVQDQLVVNPCKFTEVVEALQGYGTLELTVERLQRDYIAATQKPSLEQLEVELRHVHGWVHLGICLHLPKHSLDEIHASHSSGVDALGKCKIKMLAMWLKRSKNSTWSAFIAALLDARLWSTASKIATKYGIELPSKVLPKGNAPPQIEDVVQDAQQVKIITSMRENIELKHVELNEINEGIEQNEKEIQMLEDELTSIKNTQKSKERYTGLLMSDLQVQQLESACKEEEKQHIELQMRQLELEGSPIPEEVKKRFHQAEESAASCRLQSGQLESQIKSQREASSELAMQLQLMSSNIDDIAKELDGLQTRKKGLLRDVHKKEQELDSCLLGKSANTPFVPANAEIAYYNIMMCAGRVEVKLRQSKIDQFERKLMEKEAEAENVEKILKQQQKKLQKLKDQSLKGAKLATQPHSSDYQYAYMHMQSKNEMEAYELEQHISKLQAENLQYRIQLAVANSQKCALETEMQALLQEVVSLKTAQATLEQKIDRCTLPVLRKPKTQPPVPPSIAQPRPQLPPPLPPRHIPFSSEPQLLDPQCKLKWRRGATLPAAMQRPHVVKIRNNIYCGGGFTGKRNTARLVFKYDPTADTWSALPPCPTYEHGLSELSDVLVSVGGIMHNTAGFTPTNSVYTFRDPNWVTSLPAMPTARFDPSVFTHKTNLIACGGVTSWTSLQQYTCTSTVEVLSSETGRWRTLSPLPFALRRMSTTISDGRCYLIGGSHQDGTTNTACSASLPLLIGSSSQLSSPSAVWEVLPTCPLYCSTAAELGGCVLALGGMTQAGVSSTDVYLYSRNSKSCRKTTVVNLPIASYFATSATLSENSIIVVGGRESPESLLNTLFVVILEN